MTIQQLKKELNITNTDIAKMFGLSLDSYSNSTAKKRYEDAFVEFYSIIKSKQSIRCDINNKDLIKALNESKARFTLKDRHL